MTDKELKKLRRTDLLEILLAQSRENEQLQARIREMEEQLASRRIVVEQAGTIAEAALQLNRVFEAADDAALQYLENIRRLQEQQEEICKKREKESQEEAQRRIAEAQAEAERLEAEARQNCQAMLAKAQREAEAYASHREGVGSMQEVQGRKGM